MKRSWARPFFLNLAFALATLTFFMLLTLVGSIPGLPWSRHVAFANASSPTLSLSTHGTSGHLVGGARLFLPIRHKGFSLHYVDIAISGSPAGSQGTLGSLEGNFGFGYRRLVRGFGMVGGYTYYDRLRSNHGHLWSQVTMGFEALTDTNSLRLNAYFPQSGKKLVSSVPDDQILVSETELLYEEANLLVHEQAMRGLDIEVGQRLLSKPYETWGYIGGYTFTGADVPEVTGLRARLESTLDLSWDRVPGSKLSLSLEAQNDQRSGLQGSVGLELRFPFGIGKTPGGGTGSSDTIGDDTSGDDASDIDTSRNDSGVNATAGNGITTHTGAAGAETPGDSDPLTRTPPRRGRVMTALTEPERQVVDVQGALHPLTQQPIPRIWFVTASGNGVGSMDDPANIETVKAHSNPHDVIVFRGEDGVIDTGAGGFSLKTGQTAAAPQVPLTFMSQSGRIARIALSGEIGRLTNSEIGTPIVRLSRDNAVLGLSFEGGDSAAIMGENISGIVQIDGNSFSGHAGPAVDLVAGHHLDGPSHVVIKENNIRDISTVGIFVEAPFNHGLRTLLVSDNQVSNTKHHGLETQIFGGTVHAVDILRNAWTDIEGDAVYLKSQIGGVVEKLHIHDNAISRIDGHGISTILRTNSLVSTRISENRIDNTVEASINLDLDDNSMLHGVVTRNTISQIESAGIYAQVRHSELDATMSHNIITPMQYDSGAYGIHFLAYDHSVVSTSIVDNAISEAALGVFVENQRHSSFFLTMIKNVISQTQWEGVDVRAEESSSVVARVEGNKFFDMSYAYRFYLLARKQSHIVATFVDNSFTEDEIDGRMDDSSMTEVVVQ